MDWQELVDEGLFYADEGHFAEAERCFVEAVLLTAEFDEGDERLVMSVNNLGGLYYHAGRLEDAEEQLRHAVELTRQTWGERAPQVAGALSNLALTVEARDRSAEAEALYREGLAILDQHDAPGRDDIALSLSELWYNLGDIYREGERLPEAVSAFARALGSLERVHGLYHEEVAAVLREYVEILVALGELPRAQRSLRRLVEVRERLMGSDSPELAATLDDLAVVCRGLGSAADLREAEAASARADAIRHPEQAHTPIARSAEG